MLAMNTPYAETQRHATPFKEKIRSGAVPPGGFASGAVSQRRSTVLTRGQRARKRELLPDRPGKQRLAQNYLETMRTQRYLRVVLFLQRRLVAGGVAVPLELFFEVLAPYLYGAPQPLAGDPPAAQAPVDPTLAHRNLLAQLRDRYQSHATALFFDFFLRAQGCLLGNALLELHEGALQLFEGSVVGL
jgi:hypothetical protein